MPLDQYGRVVVTPEMNISLEDFQRLYTAEGANPAESDSILRAKAPSRAYEGLQRRWRDMGMPNTPVEYFSDPANIKPLTRGTPRAIERSRPLPTPPPSDLPRNEGSPQDLMQQIQSIIANRKASELESLAVNLPLKEIQNQSLVLHPIPTRGMSDKELLAAQLAGDSYGDVKTFLSRRATKAREAIKGNVFANVANPDISLPVSAYRSDVGVGVNTDATVGNYSTLDKSITDDPFFQRLLSTSPDRAHWMYKRLTGREFVDDYKSQSNLRELNLKAQRSLAEKLLLNDDATYDPTTDRWFAYRTVKVPSPTGFGSTEERRRVPVSDYEDRVLKADYPQRTGERLTPMTSTRSGANVLHNLNRYNLNNDPKFVDIVAKRTQAKGSALSPDELQNTLEDYVTARRVEALRPNTLLSDTVNLLDTSFKQPTKLPESLQRAIESISKKKPIGPIPLKTNKEPAIDPRYIQFIK